MRLITAFATLMILLLGLTFSSCTSTIATAPVTSTLQFVASPTIQHPNLTPSVTPNAFQKWTLQQVLDIFKTTRLEVGSVRKNNTFDLYGAPTVAVEFANFNVPSRGVDAGGLIFVFSSEADLQLVYKYYKDAGWYDSGLYYPWVFIKDNILLQINGILGEPQAKEYGDALDRLTETQPLPTTLPTAPSP